MPVKVQDSRQQGSMKNFIKMHCNTGFSRGSAVGKL